jgi:formate dehydrogenase assembly factor FdhD
MQEFIVIEDSTIAAMVNDSRFNTAIPCLFNQKSAIASSATGCGSCARRRAEAQRAALKNIKECLIGLSPEKMTELKSLLDTKQIKITLSSATGQIRQVTL